MPYSNLAQKIDDLETSFGDDDGIRIVVHYLGPGEQRSAATVGFIVAISPDGDVVRVHGPGWPTTPVTDDPQDAEKPASDRG